MLTATSPVFKVEGSRKLASSGLRIANGPKFLIFINVEFYAWLAAKPVFNGPSQDNARFEIGGAMVASPAIALDAFSF